MGNALATRGEEISLLGLRPLIARSGVSTRQCVKRVLVRDERTVQRWLAGISPIPKTVLHKPREEKEGGTL